MKIHFRNFPKAHKREDLIESLKTLQESLGRTLRSEDVVAASKQGKCASLSTYQIKFGGFFEALEAAGLQVLKRPGLFTPEELIEKVISLRIKLGRRVEVEDVKREHRRNKFPSVEAFKHGFKSVDLPLIKAERIFRERSEDGEAIQSESPEDNEKSSSN